MVDFKSLIDASRRAPEEPSVTVKALRTHRWTQQTTETEIACVVRNHEHGKVFAIAKGWVTGYENFYIRDFFETRKKRGVTSYEWTACIGTDGSWDRLVVPDASMRTAFAALGITEPT